jgi:hypothetical protein
MGVLILQLLVLVANWYGKRLMEGRFIWIMIDIGFRPLVCTIMNLQFLKILGEFLTRCEKSLVLKKDFCLVELVNLEGYPRGTVPTFSALHICRLSSPCGHEYILGHFYFTVCGFDLVTN